MSDPFSTGRSVPAFDDALETARSLSQRQTQPDSSTFSQELPSSFGGQPIRSADESTDASSGSSGEGESDSLLSTAKDKASQVTDQAGSMLSTAKEQASNLTGQASSVADTGMEKAVSGMDSLAGTLRERGESMGNSQVSSIATTAADKIEAGAEMLRGKDTDQIVTDLEALVRRKPVESVLVAAGIGFVLSKIVR